MKLIMKMNFSLEITGLSEMERDAKDKAKIVLWRCMNKMEELAKHFVPVDTGRLKNSIRLEPMHSGESEYVLADGVTYGIHQEYGTVKMRAQPFFRPAMHEVQYYWIPVFTKQVFA